MLSDEGILHDGLSVSGVCGNRGEGRERDHTWVVQHCNSPFAVLGPVPHAHLNPFYHPFYPDVTHVRKDTRLSPLFRTARDGKLGGAWEQG